MARLRKRDFLCWQADLSSGAAIQTLVSGKKTRVQGDFARQTMREGPIRWTHNSPFGGDGEPFLEVKVAGELGEKVLPGGSQ